MITIIIFNVYNIYSALYYIVHIIHDNYYHISHVQKERGQTNVTYFWTPFFGQKKQMALIFIFWARM